MSLAAAALQAFEGAPIPDPLRRGAVAFLVGSAARRMAGGADIDAAFAADMAAHPIAAHTEAANDQHYELPAAFFSKVLGPNLKYSSCLYGPCDDLAAAEARALAETCEHAGLADGQSVLELGCGWGSLSLWMAAHYPKSTITAVSNSHSQRKFIEGQAQARGLTNLSVITCDMNAFEAPGAYDRVVSVEMFEHMSNWRALLTRVKGWLKPDGKAFIHVFTHKSTPYRFDVNDKTDWIAQHFFTGGVMPSHGLMFQFEDLFTVDEDWRWSGAHYEKTAEAWLANYDENFGQLWPVLQSVYGKEARLWSRRWRLFFLATSGLFGHAGGAEWGVSHYRLAPARD
ncbi:MAG: cyclopropane-fatty-acyl-phospholipid synthase family protein [Alphaproteobacteria bacterium]